tara:strand:+ start:3221 stop:3886 length:666 start_codon:yes stop_codon:yes gene_type:complete
MENEFKKSVDAAYLEFKVEPMDQLYSNKIAGYFSRLRVKKILKEANFKDKKVLDLGCEAGYVSLMMNQAHAKVTSFDLCIPALKKFKEKLIKHNIKDITPFAAIAQKLPLKDSQFDYVVATEVFEHMPELDKVISESFRVLKPGGKLIVTFPNEYLRKKVYWIAKLFGIHTEVEDEVTLYEYSKKEIIDKLSKKFTVKKVYTFPWYFRITHMMVSEKHLTN